MSAIRATAITSTNPLKALASYGQSVWLDYIRRDLITSGKLQRRLLRDRFEAGRFLRSKQPRYN